MENLIITLIVGLIGGIIALKFKVPAGAMIGSLFFIAIFNIITGNAYFPQSFKLLTQISAGTFIGSSITYEDVKSLKSVLFPATFLIITMAIFNFLMAYFIHNTTDIDIITALFATTPGGLTDMTIISFDFGADSSKVALLQLVRLISVMIMMPGLIKFLSTKINKNNKVEKKDNLKLNVKKKNKHSSSLKENLKNIFFTLLAGTIGGLIGYISKIPSGTITFSIMGTAAYNIFTDKAYMPLKLRQAIQILAGALIGVRMTYVEFIGLKTIYIPVLIVIAGFCIMNIVLGILIYKITDFNVQTSLFSASAGGMSDMTIISAEMGADSSKVAAIHFFRLITVISLYPILISFIGNWII